MKFASIIAIFPFWTTLTTASDIFPEFPHLDDSVPRCQDNDLSLNFSNAVITEIRRDFISSHLITCLDFENNNIRRIEEGAFNKLPKLTNLYLSGNPLDNGVGFFAFGDHQTLKVLTLDRMRKYYGWSLPSISIPDYPNLEILSIRNNKFGDLVSSKKISCSRHTTFPKLKFLDLSYNGMSSTKFIYLLPESLEYLQLQDNSFRSLLPLNNVSNLAVLSLNNNKLEYVGMYPNHPSSEGLWLVGLKNLRHLSLSNNNIRVLESVAFQDTVNLVHVNLSRNHINNLYLESSANLQLLQTLDLSRNKLQNIPEISHETNIITLFLNYNNITYINEQAFARTPKLKMLSLGRNQISHINVNAFSHLRHLKTLDLSNNQLISLPKGWCDAFISLEYLNLNYNQFISLESLSLTSTLPLMEVYLAMNPLAYLNAGSFDNLPENITVRLTVDQNVDQMVDQSSNWLT